MLLTKKGKEGTRVCLFFDTNQHRRWQQNTDKKHLQLEAARSTRPQFSKQRGPQQSSAGGTPRQRASQLAKCPNWDSSSSWWNDEGQVDGSQDDHHPKKWKCVDDKDPDEGWWYPRVHDEQKDENMKNIRQGVLALWAIFCPLTCTCGLFAASVRSSAGSSGTVDSRHVGAWRLPLAAAAACRARPWHRRALTISSCWQRAYHRLP